MITMLDDKTTDRPAGTLVGQALLVSAEVAASAVLASGVFDDVWAGDPETDRAWRNGSPRSV